MSQTILTVSAGVVLPLLFALYVGLMLVLWTRGQRYSLLQYAVLTAFVVYLLVIVRFVLLPLYVRLPLSGNFERYITSNQWRFSLNVVPLMRANLAQFAMNIALFMPLGVLFPVLFVRFESAARVIGTGFMISLVIELAQLALFITVGTGRSTDIDDVIANTLGATVGYGLFRLTAGIGLLDRFIHKARLPA